MARKLIVEIVGDTSKLEKAFKTAGHDAEGFARKSQSFGSRIAKAGIFAGAAAGVGALGVAVKEGVGEFLDAQKVAAQTSAVLKSTGGAANVTARHVDDLATSILNYSGIDDEAVKTGENMLLTFKGVRNEVGKGNNIFDQATTAVADMATKMNGGAIPSAEQMQQASIQLGKALNDPIKGVGALRRVGVQLSDAQVDLVKHMVKTGDTMGAQKIILGELRTEFGNSAKAAGGTLGGQIRILQESFNNIAGEIVGTLMPTFQKLLARANAWITNARNQKKVVDAAKGAISAITGTINILVGAFNALSKIVGGNTRAIKLLVAAYATFKILQIAGKVSTLAGNFGLLARNTKTATGAARGLRGSLIGKAGLAGAALAAGFGIGQLLLKIGPIRRAMTGLGRDAYDAAAKIGLVHDPGQQFAGKTILNAAQSAAIRRQAARLETRGGLTPAQAAARLSAGRPNVAKRDIEVLAGVYGKRPGVMNVNIENLHSNAPNPRKLQDDLLKASRGRPVRRRGDP